MNDDVNNQPTWANTMFDYGKTTKEVAVKKRE